MGLLRMSLSELSADLTFSNWGLSSSAIQDFSPALISFITYFKVGSEWFWIFSKMPAEYMFVKSVLNSGCSK